MPGICLAPILLALCACPTTKGSMATQHSKPWLIIELLLLMVGAPALLYTVLPVKYLLPIIWSAALYGYSITRYTMRDSLKDWWEHSGVTRANLRMILRRFALLAPVMALGTWAFAPELLFNFVLTRPAFWLLVMVLYPLLSVIPQEIIFRAFFFSRYQRIFPSPRMMVLASGLAFGLAHILFHNWVAPVLCLIGGVMFAKTYQNTRSLLLVAIEHALYGDFLFTLGLGRYFYHGSIAIAAQTVQ